MQRVHCGADPLTWAPYSLRIEDMEPPGTYSRQMYKNPSPESAAGANVPAVATGGIRLPQCSDPFSHAYCRKGVGAGTKGSASETLKAAHNCKTTRQRTPDQKHAQQLHRLWSYCRSPDCTLTRESSRCWDAGGPFNQSTGWPIEAKNQ